MANPTESLSAELRVAIGRVSRQLRRLYAASEERGQLSFLELAVLQRVQRHPEGTAADIAPQERVTVQAVSAAVASLRDRGLVTTRVDTQDRRRTSVLITAAGTAALEGREEALGQRLLDAVKALTPSEQRALRAAVPVLDHLADLL